MMFLLRITLTLFFSTPLLINDLNTTSTELKDSSEISKNIEIINRNLEFIKKNKIVENDSVLEITKKTLNLSLKVNYAIGINTCYLFLGDIYKLKNNIDTAIYFYEKGKTNTRTNYDLKASFHYNLGELYRITGNYSESLENSLNLKDLIETNKTKNYNYYVYNLIGLSYQTLMEFELAENYFNKSAALAIANQDEGYAGIIYANIGNLLFDQNKLDEALKYFEKGVKIEEKHKIWGSASNSYTTIADIYIKKNQLDTARFFLMKGFELGKISNNKNSITHNLLNASKYYFLIKDFKNADFYLSRTIEYAKELHLNKILSEAFKLSSEINKQKGNFEQSIKDYEQFFALYSKLYDVEKIGKVKATEYELLQKEKENEIVALELKKQETINLLLYIIISLVLIVFAIITYYLHKFKLFNKELTISKIKAEESDKLKSKFLQSISHEIRTPLNGIIGFSEIMMSDNIEREELEQANSMIIKNSEDLTSTIENLVDIAHLTTNQYSIKKSEFQLIPTLLRIVNKAKESIIYKNKNDICIEFKPNQEIKLYTDKLIFTKIISHLVKNAILYTPKGKIELGYKIDKKELVIWVKDTGIGIPKDKIDVIFSPFRQADVDINSRIGGTGLGLSIVQKFIELINGSIKVDSEVNKGSIFYLSTPINN